MPWDRSVGSSLPLPGRTLMYGPVSAEPRQAAISVRSAAENGRSRSRQDGSVLPAEQQIKESSVRSAVRKSRRERLCINVTSAAGSLRIRRIRPDFARNAEILLMKVISGNSKEGLVKECV